MAINLSVRDAMTYCSTIIKNQRLTVNNMQPAKGMATLVIQTMLSPPFIWAWNRGTISKAITNTGGTDYTVVIADLGWIETQWLMDATNKVHALGGQQSLAKYSTVARPTEVAPVYDDNQGNITMRFNKVPDANYTAWWDYQRKAPVIYGPGSTFGPIPDQFAYLFLKGMLAEAALLVGDSRFALWRREWIFQLLATQDGLDEQAKNIYLNQFMGTVSTLQRAQALTKAGADGRTQ